MKQLNANIRTQSNMRRSLERHFTFLFKYLTLTKFFNLLLALIEFIFRFSKCKSFPVYLRFEVSSVCNLKCQGCSIGGVKNNSLSQKKNAFISYVKFVQSINDFIPYLLKVNLYDEGEPFLNKDIYKIISYLHNNKVCTCISSNFSLNFSDEDFVNLIESNLDHLVIALDGFDQESYARYRIGGKFDLVVNNIQRLNYFIKKYNSPLRIETQYLEFSDSNPNARLKVTELAASLEVWRHSIIENGSRYGWEGYYFKGSQKERQKLGCYYIWFSGSILTTGKYYCCDFGEDTGMYAIGNAEYFKSKNLHNNQQTIVLRKSFKNGQLNEICRKCPQTVKQSLHNATL